LLSLFQNESINGTFRIQRPIMMINYQSLKVEQFLSENLKEGLTKEQARKTQTLIITLDRAAQEVQYHRSTLAHND
jgi:flagellar biosynthesis chaperone FliJ